jgi:hypothetical protein
MQPTQEQYAVASAAIYKVVSTEIANAVPAPFRSRIPDAMIRKFCQEAAVAGLDAALAKSP